MGKPTDGGSDPDDILGLIAGVHDDTPAEQDHLDRALRTLESTHRHASAAMQRFERTGRTNPAKGPPAHSALTLSVGYGPSHRPEAPPDKAVPAAKPGVGFAPTSTEVTQAGVRPGMSPSEAPPPAADSEPTRTAIARPQKAIPVAEVLSGRGAEFVARGHTQTHIIRPKKNLPKK